ncbi:hypothetical protein [Rubrivivax rivuli]|uniref:PEP-CTERM sorting domain-containing protein n=1 Tax=Rubrivivax rivuli TaxID=1862385 RepID=A0A437REB4_9BURK|nr:hypothetical protein [Rubrivivax rivuli]RVU45097.1 hypothetical protein EOE66_13130 [Rubrivivax rivuli]
MKLKMKLVAVAAALASLAGVAHADLTSGSTVNNGSFSLLAFNTVSRDWYIRDLGYLLNSFLPSSITTTAGDGGVTGDKTPDAGLLINGSVQSNFSDAAFATWFSAQTASDVRWMVGSYDQISSSSTTSQRRVIMSSKNDAQTWTNANLDSFVASGNWGGLASFFNPGGLSKTGTNIFAQADTGANGGLNLNTLGTVGDSQSLFYTVRSAFTGSSSNLATTTRFGNSSEFATITLQANGDLIYSLAAATTAPPVPLPPALWMMGAGLVAIGGMVRRRRAAALQA